MAFYNPSISIDFPTEKAAIAAITGANSKFLTLVGSRARSLLLKNYLSGQEITLTKLKDALNRRTIRSDVNRFRTQTKIYSYPVNLFEEGRRLRSGQQESGKHIIRQKLYGDVQSRMSGYIKTFENRFLNEDLKKAGFDVT